MTEQSSEELVARVMRLERESRRQRFVLTVVSPFLVLMLISWVRYTFLGEGNLRLGGHGQGPHASMQVGHHSASLDLASSRDTACAAIDADRGERAALMLSYDGTTASLDAEQGTSALVLRGKMGVAEAVATAAGSGLYDAVGTVRAELSLTRKGPALIFYDASGRVTRRVDAAER
jgi:hypothetical protein